MDRGSASLRVLFAASWLLLGGCSVGSPGEGTLPVVFPNEGRSGDPSTAGTGTPWGTTAAMMIDSNYIPIADIDEWFDLSPDRVTVVIGAIPGAPGLEVPANVRSVFDLGPPSFSALAVVQPGVFGTVVLFDLPNEDDLDLDYTSGPVKVSVILKVDGQIRSTQHAHREAPFRITGTGGKPQEVFAETYWPGQESWLERGSHAVVRLRPTRNDFVEEQQIGSIQFDIHYNLPGFDDCVATVLSARQTSEANNRALAMVSPNDTPAPNSQRVSLIWPLGFYFTFIGTGQPTDGNVAGQGPFLDLWVAEIAEGNCDMSAAGWFELHDLTVTDLDGVPIITKPGHFPIDFHGDGLGPQPQEVFRAYLIDDPA